MLGRDSLNHEFIRIGVIVVMTWHRFFCYFNREQAFFDDKKQTKTFNIWEKLTKT
ncbi:hypothetical protein GCM10008933_40560 [Paenibacillus motobuensis]|uniref:Uncharacterized protein n=1 Tax=Paenibacillus motobuensis TaxID=295324 RepID=A0ABP3IJK2_9BACL